MTKRKPFNDGNEFLQKHIGVPQQAHIKKLPKPLRFIGYMIIAMIVIMAILLIVSYILQFLN